MDYLLLVYQTQLAYLLQKSLLLLRQDDSGSAVSFGRFRNGLCHGRIAQSSFRPVPLSERVGNAAKRQKGGIAGSE